MLQMPKIKPKQSITMPLIFRKQITSKQESVLQTLQGGMVELINNSSTWGKKKLYLQWRSDS